MPTILMKRDFIEGPFWLPATLLLLLLFNMRMQAHIYIITETNDTTDVTSLRGAVIDANHKGGNNSIILGYEGQPEGRDRQPHQWIYHLTIHGPDEDAALSGDLDITRGHLEIAGVGANVVIDATGLGDRVFQVFSNANLTLTRLVIKGGTAATQNHFPFVDGEAGGAIYNSGNLFLEDCVIAGNSSGESGRYTGGDYAGAGGDGGALCNSGTVIMLRCVVRENSGGAGFDGGSGGGIRNVGWMRLDDCTVTGNVAGPGGGAFLFGGNGGNGGGIHNSGMMILHQTTIDGNSAGSGAGSADYPGWGGLAGAGGSGAGIYSGGTLLLTRCTVSHNIAGSGGNGGSGVVDLSKGGTGGAGGCGAGIYSAGQTTLETCTISGNTNGNGGSGGVGGSGGSGGAGGSGAGIYNTSALSVESCTVSFNSAGLGGNSGNSWDSSAGTVGAPGGSGGGIASEGDGTSAHLRNSLIALNSTGPSGQGGTASSIGAIPWPGPPPAPSRADAGPNGSGPDLAGAFVSQAYNLIGMANGSTGFANRLNGDQVGSISSPINPLLGPLEMNGGPMPTHALLPGSPAIDQGKCFGICEDQRGERRPYDYGSVRNALGGDGSDVGAFELHPTATHER